MKLQSTYNDNTGTIGCFFMSQSKCQIRLIRWTENPYRGSNCSLRVYMSEPNLKEVNGGGGGVGWCWRERGEGRAS